MDALEPNTGQSGKLSPRAQQLKDELLGEFSLTVDDVAGILEVDRTTIYRYIQDGALAGLKIGREYRLSEADVKGFLASLIERERRRVAELRLRGGAHAQDTSEPRPLPVREPASTRPGEAGALLRHIVQAQAKREARDSGHQTVHPAHLLLALLADATYLVDSPFPVRAPLGEGLGRQVLERLGADIPRLRAASRALLPPPDTAPGSDLPDRPLTPPAAALAGEGARSAMAALGRRWVGTDCLLLALCGEPELAAALDAAGAEPEALRMALQRTAPLVAAVQDGPRYAPLAIDVCIRAAHRAAAEIEPSDLLAALLEDAPPLQDSIARRALAKVGADLATIRAGLPAPTTAAGTPQDGAQFLPQPAAALRTVVFERAPAAAGWLGHQRVATEHLLLGLYSIPAIGALLADCGAPHAAVRAAIRALAPAGAATPTENRSTRFVRMSQRAQQIVVRAQHEARRTGSRWVATEHVLLALLADEDAGRLGLARRALEHTGVDVAALRQRLEARLARSASTPADQAPGEIQWTPNGKKLLMVHAPACVAAMGLEYVGTEHLLLGAFAASPELATLLEESGAVRADLEAAVLQLLSGTSPEPAVPSAEDIAPLTRQATAEARRLGHAILQPAHYLLALLAEDPEVRGCAARAVLERLGADLPRLRANVEDALPRTRGPRPRGTVAPGAPARALLAEHAVAAARAMGAERLDSGHLLLGLYAQEETAGMLAAAGAPEDAVRVELAQR